jgi:HPt (histidine-containing phosphotransfer) domain-containing protein
MLSAFGIPARYITGSELSTRQRYGKTDIQSLHYDLGKLSKLLGDDKAEIIDLIEKFIELTPEYSAALYIAYEQNNFEEVARTAHKIKSSLELLASGNLRSNIRLINEYARNQENLEKLPKLIKYFSENIPVLLRQLGEKATEMRNKTRDLS